MGGLSRRLADGSLVALDSCVFIYHVEAHQRYRSLTGELFQGIQARHWQAVTSVVTLMELTVRPWQLGREDVAREYVNFLERIAAGDYSASLDLSTLTERRNLPRELVSLGEYINTTVASLVSALNEARTAQQTYMRQSWQSLMEAGRAPGGYRYHVDEQTETSRLDIVEDAWLPPMTQAVQSKQITIGKEELALPIASGARAQLIGALGVRRTRQEEWSEDELALVTAVTDQLAQTLENLRLLDETTRRAAREQMAGEITGHIREAVEIEEVLERALSELGRALAVERGAVYLALQEQGNV